MGTASLRRLLWLIGTWYPKPLIVVRRCQAPKMGASRSVTLDTLVDAVMPVLPLEWLGSSRFPDGTRARGEWGTRYQLVPLWATYSTVNGHVADSGVDQTGSEGVGVAGGNRFYSPGMEESRARS